MDTGDNSSSNTCQPCYKSSNNSSSPFTCATCSGNSSNDCLSCQTGTFLYPNTGGQCLASCPNGYWEDSSTNTCIQCSNPDTDPSSCPGQTLAIIMAVVAPVSSTLPAVLAATISVFQQTDTVSGRLLNLFLCLSAIESIANMRYLNLNHSQIALGAYSGLSGSKGTNWIARYNRHDRGMLTFEYGIFDRNGLSSLYLDNAGHSLAETMAYFAAYLLIGAFSLRRTKEELINGWIGRTYVAIFGLFASTLAGHFQSQILFAVIQLLKPDLLVDAYTITSHITAYFVFCAVIGLQLVCFFKVRAIFNKKTAAEKVDSPENNGNINGRRAETRPIPANNLISETIPPSIDDKWDEMKYAMFFDSFKDTSKHSFFFTYWMTLYNILYILLILSLQNVPVLQCLSIIILVIICVLTSAIIKPFKEKSITPFNFLF